MSNFHFNLSTGPPRWRQRVSVMPIYSALCVTALLFVFRSTPLALFVSICSGCVPQAVLRACVVRPTAKDSLSPPFTPVRPLTHCGVSPPFAPPQSTPAPPGSRLYSFPCSTPCLCATRIRLLLPPLVLRPFAFPPAGQCEPVSSPAASSSRPRLVPPTASQSRPRRELVSSIALSPPHP
jgi:hypothetical protein